MGIVEKVRLEVADAQSKADAARTSFEKKYLRVMWATVAAAVVSGIISGVVSGCLAAHH